MCNLLLSLETTNGVQSVAYQSKNTQAISNGSDLTARMRRLICSFCWSPIPHCWKSHALAYFIIIVLSLTVASTTATQITNQTSQPITKVMSTTGTTQKSATPTKRTQTAAKQSTQAITKQATQPTTNQTPQLTSTASSWLVTVNSSSLPGVTSVKPIATMPPKPCKYVTVVVLSL